MLESLKSLWARWKVQVSFVGGALVVATTFGTCSYDPQTVSEVEVETPATEEATLPATETTTVTTETETTTSDENTTGETTTIGE